MTAILPASHHSIPIPSADIALAKWSQDHNTSPPQGQGACREKNWDGIRSLTTASSLLDKAADEVEHARLQAVMSKDSGAWLEAVPNSSLGLRLDNESLRIAVGLRLGTAICVPHLCRCCGAEVTALGTHGLSCRSSSGRYHRHSAINDIIHRTLSAAHVPSRLEPQGLVRTDGKRPDGMTLTPWSVGRPLVWDATCPDTYASSYRVQATSGAGKVAELAEVKKDRKYSLLGATYLFTPVAIETSGAIGPRSRVFLRELGRRVRWESGEPRATSYLLQRLSVAVQRGNAAVILDCIPSN